MKCIIFLLKGGKTQNIVEDQLLEALKRNKPIPIVHRMMNLFLKNTINLRLAGNPEHESKSHPIRRSNLYKGKGMDQ